MKRIATTAVLFIFCLVARALPAESIAFYYGSNLPVSQLQLFNTVVVDPHYVPKPKKNETDRSHWYAYVSAGEVSPKRSYYTQIKRKWIIGQNKTWKSKVLDQTNKQWRHFFVNVVIKKLWDAGYRGFFLDTMDSYYLAAKDPKKIKAQQRGLTKLIKAIKKRYPQAKLILNRGFELLPAIHADIKGIAAESLYYGYNHNSHGYVNVKPADRRWLQGQFKKAKDYGLKTIAIDYVPPAEQAKARADAKRLSAEGFVPWVTDISLESVGVSSIFPIPREVMMVYSSKQNPDMMVSPPLQYLALPLNYMGYIPRLYDVEKTLPAYSLVNRVAGVVIWLDSTPVRNEKKLLLWVKHLLAQKIPVVLVGSLNYYLKDKPLMKIMGLKYGDFSDGHASISQIDKRFIGFEESPVIEKASFFPLQTKKATVLLQFKNKKNETMDVVAITHWGGYALTPYIVSVLPNQQSRYIIDPFKFLQQTLRLPAIPIPDVTTENGRRILIGHIDGDAFYSRSEWSRGPYAGESMLRTILQKYKIPTDVSIVEGEIGRAGLKPELAPKFEKIARDIFKLPWVEIANHSYSHPYKWRQAYKNTGKIIGSDTVERLYIPGYRFSLKREIIDSTNYINNKLSPPDKKCKVFLWTGDTDPPAKAVGMAYQIGLLNMNSGNTIMSRDYPSLAAVSAMGVYKGKYLQVFAPIQNENLYTNLWTGPFYGFKRVIETFQMTNRPRRLKPMDIYCHFYSASKISSLKALDSVYAWAVKQPVTPEFGSTYIKKVLDYYSLAVAKTDKGWLVHGNGNIKEFRWPSVQQYPKLNESVVGFNAFDGSHYLHTTNSGYHQVSLQKAKPSHIYLQDSNAVLQAYKQAGSGYVWTLKSYIPFIAQFSHATNCQFMLNGKLVEPAMHDGVTTVSSTKEGRFEVEARCET